MKEKDYSTDISYMHKFKRKLSGSFDNDSENTSMISNDSDIDIEDDLLNLADQIEIDSSNIGEVGTPLTPRTRFISTCIKEGLNPRANMVRLMEYDL